MRRLSALGAGILFLLAAAALPAQIIISRAGSAGGTSLDLMPFYNEQFVNLDSNATAYTYDLNTAGTIKFPVLLFEQLDNVQFHIPSLPVSIGSAPTCHTRQYFKDDGTPTTTGNVIYNCKFACYGDTTAILTKAYDADIQHLNEGALTTHANWDVTGAADDTGGNLTWTAGSGTATQTAANMAAAVQASSTYLFTYTVSSPSGGPTCALSGVSASTGLDEAAGTNTTTITTAAAPGDFVITCDQTITLDDLSFLEYHGSGSLPVSGTINVLFEDSWSAGSAGRGLCVKGAAMNVEFEREVGTAGTDLAYVEGLWLRWTN